jgi:3-phenylpropionate/trans-cinnamate dioxygenase ferredoxin reductase subunit
MSESPAVVIVGAGHAGGTAAAFLRQFGHTGAITVIGNEPVPPYQRPPLSKAWLKGTMATDAIQVRPRDFYAGHAIALRLGVTVTAIDRAARRVALSDGSALPYDRLILATGRRARRLPIPGMAQDGVHELRTLADAERLKPALAPGRRLAVIGGGYVGLEVAATARESDTAVVVIEREARVLARVACAALSDFFQDYHRARGVRFELAMGVMAISGAQGRADGVVLADGRHLAADAVLVGVGAIANDELAAAAGLDCDNGICVDLNARTRDPAIQAIGDCSRRPLPHYDRIGHLESVQNALEQARQAAADIVGRPQLAPEVPWFWSDQYDLKLQIAGLAHEVESVVIRGAVDSAAVKPRFAVFHLDARRCVRAVEAINAAQEFMVGKQLIQARTVVDVARLADPAIPMKAVAS